MAHCTGNFFSFSKHPLQVKFRSSVQILWKLLVCNESTPSKESRKADKNKISAVVRQQCILTKNLPIQFTYQVADSLLECLPRPGPLMKKDKSTFGRKYAVQVSWRLPWWSLVIELSLSLLSHAICKFTAGEKIGPMHRRQRLTRFWHRKENNFGPENIFQFRGKSSKTFFFSIDWSEAMKKRIEGEKHR